MLRFCMVLLVACTTAGCGGESGPQRVAVAGRVTNGGEPVANGRLTFTPKDSSLQRAFGLIVDGKYRISAENGPEPGAYIAAIVEYRETGEKIAPSPYGIDQTPQAVTREVMLGGQGTLEVEIRAIGDNTHDFLLGQ